MINFSTAKVGGNGVKGVGEIAYASGKQFLKYGGNKALTTTIPVASIGLSNYLNAPTNNDEVLYSGPTDTTLVVGGGLLANQGTKTLSKAF